jgi:ribonucleotide monophosphatase NagD (HAD superfamily)
MRGPDRRPVEAVTGRRVERVVGKPSPMMLEMALEVLGLVLLQ